MIPQRSFLAQALMMFSSSSALALSMSCVISRLRLRDDDELAALVASLAWSGERDAERRGRFGGTHGIGSGLAEPQTAAPPARATARSGVMGAY